MDQRDGEGGGREVGVVRWWGGIGWDGGEGGRMEGKGNF